MLHWVQGGALVKLHVDVPTLLHSYTPTLMWLSLGKAWPAIGPDGPGIAH
jgi:hypothetical protein